MHRLAAWTRLVVVLTSFVATWRIAVWLRPAAAPPATTVHWSLGLLGLVFLACGVGAFFRAPSRATLLFALYGAAGGLHWGGWPGAGGGAVEGALLVFYLVASSFLPAALLLHLALAYPPAWPVERRPWVRTAIYLPSVAAAGVGVALLTTGGPTASPIAPVLAGLLILPTLGSLVGLVIFLARWRRSKPEPRRRSGLHLILIGAVVAVVTSLVSSLGLTPWRDPQGLNFAFAALPLALFAALERQRGVG